MLTRMVSKGESGGGIGSERLIGSGDGEAQDGGRHNGKNVSNFKLNAVH
jgi:hypothetical protein